MVLNSDRESLEISTSSTSLINVAITYVLTASTATPIQDNIPISTIGNHLLISNRFDDIIEIIGMNILNSGGVSNTIQINVYNGVTRSPQSDSYILASGDVLQYTKEQGWFTSTTGGAIDVSALATHAIQTDGTQKTQIVDAGGEAVTITGGKLDVNASVDTTGLATSAKQDTGNTSLTTIAGKDFATQTTLAAVLAKIIAAPSTEAKQDSIITLLTTLNGYTDGIEALLTTLNSKDFATQTTEAAILAKIIAAPATEAKQDSLLTAINLLAKLTDTQPVSVASIPTHAVTQSGIWNIGEVSTMPIVHTVVDSGTITSITNALPTGTNNIGDMDVASIVPTTDVFGTGTLGSLNAAVTITANGINGCVIRIGSGLTGTVVLEGSTDSFGTSQNISVLNLSTGLSVSTGMTAAGYYRGINTSGWTQLRIRVSVYGSGTCTGTINSSTRSNIMTVVQQQAANMAVTATPITLIKGTQGSTGFSTQDLKDAGRVSKRFYAVAAAAGTTTTQTAITLTQSSQDAATSTDVSFIPTAGKTFRITAITFATRGHSTATAQTTTFNLRMNTAGAVTTSSTPILLSMRSATPATANSWDRVYVDIPDGIEIYGDGTKQWGVTAAATYTTNAPTWDVTIIGFEY